ncbi:hypothetical protein ACFL47_05440 [Candidatus Latescibacterota bacterium]
MIKDDYLKNLEKKIYETTICDGLLDIFCGLIFIAAGLVPILENIGFSRFITVALLVPPLMAIVPLGKKNITNPRLGIVILGESRSKLKRNMRIVYWIVAVTTSVLIILAISGAYRHVWSGYFKSSVLGTYIILTLGLTAFFVDFRRLYFLALLGGVGMPLYEYLGREIGKGISAGLIFCLPGLIFSLYGIVLLHRFILANPPNENVEGAI